MHGTIADKPLKVVLISPPKANFTLMPAEPLGASHSAHLGRRYLTGKYYHANEGHWLPKERLDAAWTQRRPPFSDHEPKSGQNRIIGGGILSIGPASIGVESMPDTAIVNNTRGWLLRSNPNATAELEIRLLDVGETCCGSQGTRT